MNYLGKVGGIINTAVGTLNNQQANNNSQLVNDLQVELKRRDKMVKEF